MPEKITPIELYKKVREPLKVTNKMKEGATELEEDGKKRSGETVGEGFKYTRKWEQKLNEENMRDDHGAYEDKS